MARLTRAERTARTRAELLSVARQEFVSAGYHGATLERIAERAGYTKGAVYSRFPSKADLFFELLEARIHERADQNRRLAEGVHGADGLEELLQRWSEIQHDDMAWTLLVVEFRVHAARDPVLNRRYAELHQRTVDRLTDVLSEVLGADVDGAAARMVLGSGAGIALEEAVHPGSVPPSLGAALAQSIARGVLAAPAPSETRRSS